MGSDRVKYAWIALGYCADLLDFPDAGAYRNHQADACLPCPRDDGIALFGKVREVEMAMAVDKHQALPSAST